MDRGCGTLVCRVLGGIDFDVDGEPVALRGRQRRRLAAALVASAPRPVGTDELIGVLHAEAEDTSGADPANAVHAHVRRLRALIEPGVTPAASFRLTWGPAGYRLIADDVDLWRYNAAVAAADEWRRTDPRKAVAGYEHAFALWDSPFGDLASDEALGPYAEPIASAHLNHVGLQRRSPHPRRRGRGRGQDRRRRTRSTGA